VALTAPLEANVIWSAAVSDTLLLGAERSLFGMGERFSAAGVQGLGQLTWAVDPSPGPEENRAEPP
jgi:hypothetical protein